MKRIMLALSVASILGGCISIATHEEEMRRCRAAAASADQMTARASDLEKQNADLAGKLASVQATSDELSKQLKAEVASGDVGVKQEGENVTITLGDKVLFKSGEWELQPRGRQVLLQVAEILKKTEDKIFRVEGHTDNVKISGPLKSRFPTNWDLSSARASAVVRYLEAQGVPSQRLELAAFGDQRPLADNATPEGRSQNRRVEIAIVPVPAKADKK